MSENQRLSEDLKGQVEDLIASPELARAVESDEFRQFLDHVPVAILVSRVRGDQARIVYCNATFEKMTGTSCAETVGAGWSALDMFVEEEKPHRKLGEAIRDGEDFLGLFRRDAAPDQVSLVEAYVGAIQNADGSENYRIAALVDVSDRDRQQRERLRQEVRDKDMLLKELQHRVKNNLQLVIALIRIESRQVREGGEVDLERLARRVEALALLYRALTADHDVAGDIDLGHYLSEIASAVMRSHGTEGIRLEINVEPCPISVNIAMPAGLVINEVITNAFKHAFPEGRDGKIIITCLRKGEHYYIGVQDDGVGLPIGARWPQPGKISDLMVRSLRENSGADLHVESHPGQGVKIAFRVKAPA